METKYISKEYSLTADIFLKTSSYDFHKVIYILRKLLNTKPKFGIKNFTENIRFKEKIHMGPINSVCGKIFKCKNGFIFYGNVLTFAGVYGPLPWPYTERFFEKKNEKNNPLRDFLDIFYNRLCILWHVSETKITPSIASEDYIDNPIGKILSNMIGNIEEESLLRALFPFVGILWGTRRSSEGLKVILIFLLGTKISIREFIGGFIRVKNDDLTKIGDKYYGNFNVLGKNTILGKYIWDQSYGIMIEIGPLDFVKYEEMLPSINSKKYNIIKNAINYYLGILKEVVIELKILSKDTRPLILGRRNLLGQTTWLNCSKLLQEREYSCKFIL